MINFCRNLGIILVSFALTKIAKAQSFSENIRNLKKTSFILKGTDTIEWNAGACQYKGVFDRAKHDPDTLLNTLILYEGAFQIIDINTRFFYKDDPSDKSICLTAGLKECPTRHEDMKSVFVKLRKIFELRKLDWEASIKAFRVEKTAEEYLQKVAFAERHVHEVSMRKLDYLISGNSSDLKKPLLGRKQDKACLQLLDILIEPKLEIKLSEYRKLLKRDYKSSAKIPSTSKSIDLDILNVDWPNCMLNQAPFPEQVFVDSLFKSIQTPECDT